MKKIISLLLIITLLQQTVIVFAIGSTPTSNQNGNFKLEKIAENEQAILYLDKELAMLRIESKKTKNYVDTKVFDGKDGNEVTRNSQKSDLVFTYIDNARSASLKSIDTYSMAVAFEQVEYEFIENGVKIKYSIGEDKLTLNDFPKYVDRQKMVDLVVSKLTKKQKDSFEEVYRIVGDSYLRTKDDGVSDLKLQQLYDYMFNIGSYTLEDLETDNAQYGIEIENSLIHINSSIEYQLDGMDLVVSIPVNELEINEKNPIVTIGLLSHFMSSTQQDNGYIFVPDGSGAIIEFNNGRKSAVNYSTKVYQEDVLKNMDKYKPDLLPTTLPIFGIKWDKMAMLAIIEKGETMAEIIAEISGKSDEFNKVGVNFTLRDIERVSAIGNPTVTQPKFSKDVFNESIVVRYKMIEENITYAGMAKNYQQYLIDKGQIVKREIQEDAPLFIEFIGSIDKRKLFLGVSYNSTESLTTFKQAENILKDIKNKGINNLKVEYNGWMNGGVKHTAISNLKLESVLGNKTDFNELLSFTASNGIDFFPVVNFSQSYTKKDLNTSKQVARYLSGDTAWIELKQLNRRDVFSVATLAPFSSDWSFLISPNYLVSYVDKFISNVKKLNTKNIKDLDIKGISATDIGQIIVPDYNTKRDVGRHNALVTTENVLNTLSNNYNLMLSNPNAYALKNTTYVTNLPFGSNKYNVVNYDIPFVQMVLDGYIEYSSISLNDMLHKDMSELMLYSIESKTAPKFLIINENEKVLVNTIYTSILSGQYSKWENKIVDYYNEYNEFYQSVKNAEIKRHEVLSNGIRKITYTNGVKVYINYDDKQLNADSLKIESKSYVISK